MLKKRGGNILKNKKNKKREQHRVLSTSTCEPTQKDEWENGFSSRFTKNTSVLLITFHVNGEVNSADHNS